MKILNSSILFLSFLVASCVTAPESPKSNRFQTIRERYFVEFLKRNPVVCTYLGGEGYSEELSAMSSMLRDWSPKAIEDENRFYREISRELEAVNQKSLNADEKIDLAVMQAQIQFLLRLTETRKHQLRCVETYTSEPARGVDWAIQGMSSRTDGGLGSEKEWEALSARVEAIPVYLFVAQENLSAGITAGVYADGKMIERDGISAAQANAKFFGEDLAKQAAQYLQGSTFGPRVLNLIERAGVKASTSYLGYRDFLSNLPRKESFQMGEAEYNWALKNNLAIESSARELFQYSAGKVAETQKLMFALAEKIAKKRDLGLIFGTDEEKATGTRAVMDALGKDSPSSDDQLLSWCKERSSALIAYARKHQLFDLPADYKLDIVETPPQLRSAIEAAYYPAPPFKKTGVGRFYLTPTGNDPAQLAESNRHSLADLCAHEGFPGHDWHYQYMNAHASAISPIRWLTPGSVEDTCSMWEDSMAAEGWALYAEELMAEPQADSPNGFYTDEERLYQLNWQLLRDVRVRVDVGIHLGLMSFNEAVDYFASHVSFIPLARSKAEYDATAKAVLENAERAIYRYSKWPTQAITYHLGKKAILELRAACAKIAGPNFSPRRFHELFMEQGTIPAGYFRERLLARAKEMVSVSY